MKRTQLLSIAAVCAMAIASAACSSSSGSAASTTFSVGGTLTGLSGTVVLQNNAGNDLSLTADGAFTFTTELADAATYAVTVLTQPSGQVCTVSSGTGTIASADVTDVAVTCGIGVSSVTGTVLSASGAVADTAIATTGTTGVAGSAATPLTVTFSTTIDAATLSNLTVSCGGEPVVGGTVAPLTNTTEYTLTAPTTGLPPLTSCEFGFPATITDADGNPITASTYTFTTGCSTNDNFAVDTVTGGCWSTTAGTPIPAVSNGTLSLTMAAAGVPPTTPTVYKTLASIPNGFTATAKITATVSGEAACGIVVGKDSRFPDGNNVIIGIGTDPTGFWVTMADGTLGIMGPVTGSTGDYFCVKVNTDGSIFAGQAATALECIPVALGEPESGSVPGANTIPVAEANTVVGLTGISLDTSSTTCTFDEFTITNAIADVTATGPIFEY